ncbi:two-component system, NtrC family, sensor kinase [Gammaproteobacteria bacterium]
MAGLGTLVAGVAHEINNPINFVHLGSHSLEESIQKQKEFFFPLLEEEPAILDILHQQYQAIDSSIGNIKEGSARIKSIVEDLRTFSRLDEAERKVVNIVESLNSTLRITQTQFQKRVRVISDFQAQPEVECWPAKLNQVFMNIIVNGCHAIEMHQDESNAPIPGVLTVRTFDREHEGKNELGIQFQDTGCGMIEEVRKKMFEPFFTTKPVGHGTGLGLSISYSIIQEHQGRIDVISQPHYGTTVTLWLPLS